MSGELLRCPRCNSVMISTTAFNEGPSTWWLECSNTKCNTYYNTYVPQAHQAAFHSDDHRISGNFGG